MKIDNPPSPPFRKGGEGGFEIHFLSKSLLTACLSQSGSTYQLGLMGCPFIYCFYVGKPDHTAWHTTRSTGYYDVDVFGRD